MDRAPQVIIPGAARSAKHDLPRVAVAVPSGDHVHANFAMMALAPLVYYCGIRQYPIAIVSAKGSLIQANRNNAVRQALEYKCDWLLFLDSDMTFPANALERLLAHERDIVGATYARRSPPHHNMAKPLPNGATAGRGLMEVEALPTGCLLIRMSVFDKLVRPYFRCGAINEGETFDGIPGPIALGEDYNFCRDARAAGFSVWLDTQLSFELIHWGEIGYRLVDGEDPAAKPYETVEVLGV